MLKEFTERSAGLTDIFRNENEKQGKEFEYLELQGNILTE